eukprot:4011734-Karenia_brevis.AAC.1
MQLQQRVHMHLQAQLLVLCPRVPRGGQRGKAAKEKVAGGMAMERMEADAPCGDSDGHGSLQA